MPAVSIVTATLNRVGYLREALRSALAQSFTDFEILVCDDGSLEETRQLCESLGDFRIKHIVNQAPRGIALNTLFGISQASGELVAILNDDDRWTPEFLSKCTRPLLQDQHVVLVFADHWLIDEKGRRLEQESDENSRLFGRAGLPTGTLQDAPRALADNAIPLAMGSVFRKSAVDWGMYSEQAGGAYDFFISYCLLRSGCEAVYINERLTEYRVHDASASATRALKNACERYYVHYAVMQDPHFSSVSDRMRRQCIGLLKQIMKTSLLQRNLPTAMDALSKLIQIHTRGRVGSSGARS